MVSISQAEYRERRQKFLAQLPKDSIAILPANPNQHKSADNYYPYFPNTNLYYLTGYDEADCVAVFLPGRKEGEYVLFNLPKDRSKEIWVGYRVGQEGAKQHFGVDQAFAIGELIKVLPTLMEGRKILYYALGRHAEFDPVVLDALNVVRAKVRAGVQAPQEIINLETIIHEMRLIKSPSEIAIMRHAAQVSVGAHKAAMKAARHGIAERAIEAELMCKFMQGGCRESAYPNIVASGPNGIILHYTINHDYFKDGDLVLIDAAGAYEYYSSDVTNTFPINGRFSSEQKAIYDIVLKAHDEILKIVKPGLSWNAMQEKAYEVMTEGLIALGILQGDKEKLLADRALSKFYMHHSGHWLGLDTHDAGEYKINNEWRPLQAGMVLTVEPGLYLSREVPGLDKKWWDIAIRIEDDILVTETGYDNLSKGLPRTTEEIEAFMQKSA